MERKVIIRTGFEICFLGICFAWLLHTPSSLTHTTIIEFINLVLATALVNTEELIIQKLNTIADIPEKLLCWFCGWITYMGFFWLSYYLTGRSDGNIILILVIGSFSISLHMLGAWLSENIAEKKEDESFLYDEDDYCSGDKETER